MIKIPEHEWNEFLNEIEATYDAYKSLSIEFKECVLGSHYAGMRVATKTILNRLKKFRSGEDL